MSDNIQIPRFVEGRIFYNNSVSEALADVSKSKHKPLYMDELLAIRSINDKDSWVWNDWYCAPSVRVTGKTKQGKNVVVYGHVPNYFSNPKNISASVSMGLKNGAGMFGSNPKNAQKEFQKLLDLEDNENVFIVDYDSLKSSVSGVIKVSEALKHPQIIPFIGGKEKAEKYLAQHEKVLGNSISVGYRDDLADEPFGCVLFADGRYGGGYILGYNDLDCSGRFLGVPLVGGADARKISPLEKMVGKGVDVGNGL